MAKQAGLAADNSFICIKKALSRASKRAINPGKKDIYYIFTPLMPNTRTRLILKKPKPTPVSAPIQPQKHKSSYSNSRQSKATTQTELGGGRFYIGMAVGSDPHFTIAHV